MATRRAVREAVYADAEQAVGDLLEPERITQEYPAGPEDLPHVVHDDDYSRARLNTGSAPHSVTQVDSDTLRVRYGLRMEGLFTFGILDTDEQRKEDIYEAFRSHFERYQLPADGPGLDTTSLNEDVDRVVVGESTSVDEPSREPVARGDEVAVRVYFTRYFEQDVEAIDQVDRGVDVGDDGTIDLETITDTNS